jgi:predicted enzyme related to lactoylglutathione lyase
MTELLVNIDVDDLQRGIAFYCDGLGLRTGRRFGADGIELLGAPAPVYLLVKSAGTQPVPGSGQIRDYRRHWSPIHLDFVVADIEAAVARAVAAGATLERPVRAAAWGKLALLADPFGHGFCLIQFVGRGYDEVASA